MSGTSKPRDPAKSVAKIRDAINALKADLAETPLPGVDTLAQLNACVAALEETSAKAKDALRATMQSRGVSELTGQFFLAQKIDTVRATIDAKALREEQPAIAARYTKSSPVSSITFKAAA